MCLVIIIFFHSPKAQNHIILINVRKLVDGLTDMADVTCNT